MPFFDKPYVWLAIEEYLLYLISKYLMLAR